MNKERWAACTIASANYLDFVMTSYESFFRYHPGQRFFVLVVDKPEQVAQRDYPFEVVYAKDLPIRDYIEHEGYVHGEPGRSGLPRAPRRRP